MRPPALRRGFSALILAGFALALLGGVRGDELDCESAVAHLQRCCDGARGVGGGAEFTIDPYACDYAKGCGRTQLPALDEHESACILERSCAELRDEGICGRAAHAERISYEGDTKPSMNLELVCP